MVRRWEEDQKEVTKTKPHWTLASLREVVALRPVMVQGRRWMEPREQMQRGHKTL